MNLSATEYESSYTAAGEMLGSDWRSRYVLRDPAKREWLATAITEAVDAEYPQFAGVLHRWHLRRQMESCVSDRVKQANVEDLGAGTFGFVILPIVLAAILSWLIQKLLNHLFPNV